MLNYMHAFIQYIKDIAEGESREKLVIRKKARVMLIQLCMVHIVKAMVFPVVMHRYESWTIKKAECQIIDAFELWCYS